MNNLLFVSPPKELEVDGELYPISYDYRSSLRVVVAFQDQSLLPAEKTAVLLANIYGDNVPDNLKLAVEEAMWFLDCGVEERQEVNPLRLYSFEKDAGLIYAAFQQSHNIDLDNTELHWWKFVTLLMDVGQKTTFSQLVALRKRVKTGKATKDERKVASELGDMFVVEDFVTPQDKQEQEAFEQAYKEAKRKRDEKRKQ